MSRVDCFLCDIAFEFDPEYHGIIKVTHEPEPDGRDTSDLFVCKKCLEDINSSMDQTKEEALNEDM